MLKVGIRTARTLLKTAHKVTEKTADAVGLSKPLEQLQDGVTSLPVVEDVVNFVQVAADQLAPEKMPLYKQDAGPNKVGVHHQTFQDEVRGREIPTTFYYPENVGKAESPVVVFSQGMAANRVTYHYLGKHLASHGYTVVHPSHVGSNTLSLMRRLPTSSFSQRELVDRTKDVSFSLDTLENGSIPERIAEQADMSKVALAGHSFGALTAQAMAGLEAKDPDGKSLSLEDDRIDAFVAMSPYGDSAPTNLLGLDVETYGNIEKPVMYMSGDKDNLFTLGRGHKVHSQPYQESGSEDKYNVVIGGARHLDFGQVYGLLDPNTAELAKSSSVAFLDAHLKQDEDAKSYLVDELPGVARSWDSLAQSS